MSLGTAIKAFFSVLFNRQVAERVRAALSDAPPKPSLTSVADSRPAKSQRPEDGSADASGRRDSPSASPGRSDAITLLSTLQREARLVDLICEPLDQFSDAQVGAAAREVLKDSRIALDRLFAIEPLASEEEGQSINVNSSVSPSRVRLIGQANGTSGVIVHRGWQATKCEMPVWKGSASEALILAPTEIEVQ